jgi:2-polyprenyl-6-methoxyphenol hydroxylase-like FAD-dependent oxidoreductase
MPLEDRIDVLVVGAGPVGMLSALLLAQRGTEVRVIDQEWRTASRTYACALHPRTLQILDRVGLGPEIMAAGRKVSKVAFYEGASRMAELNLAELPGPFPFVLVLAQSIFEELLEQHLRKLHQVKVEWNHHLASLRPDGDTVSATVEKLGVSAKGYIIPEMEWTVERTAEVNSSFVIGADGSRSKVAQELGISFDSVGEPEFYAVYEFESNWDSGDELRIVLEQDTTSVLWPLPGGRFRWSFQLREEHLREFPAKERSPIVIDQPALSEVDRQFINNLVRQRAPWFKGTIRDIGWSTDVEFGHFVAKQFGRDRCWLAGDAAHQTSPAGMQSMNGGLMEAEQLAALIHKVHSEKAAPDLLESYSRNRREEWEQLLGLSKKVTAKPQVNSWIKERSARILSCIPGTGDEHALLAKQIGLEMR